MRRPRRPSRATVRRLRTRRAGAMTSTTHARDAQPTVRRAYAVAHGWEHAAALSVEQNASIAQLTSAVSGAKDAPEAVVQREAKASSSSRGDTDGDVEDIEKDASTSKRTSAAATSMVKLTSAHAFYTWFAEVEERADEERRAVHRAEAESLRGEIRACDEVIAKLDAVDAGLETLVRTQHEMNSRSRRTQEESERLLAEKDRLIEFADALRGKLDYFDQLEKVAEQFQAGVIISSASNPSGHGVAPREQVMPMLKRLDDCLEFVQSHPTYAQGGNYGTKFRQLQTRALSTVREYYVSALRKAVTHVQDAAKGKKNSGTADGGEYDEIVVDEGDETSLLYVRFRASATELRDLTEELEKRGRHDEYAALLSDCHVLYCEQRASLLAGSVKTKMRAIASAENKKDVIALARIGSAYLTQVCQAEYGLFQHFFPNTDPTGALSALMIPLGTYLSDILRPRYISITDLGLLAELVDAFKGELLVDINSKAENAAALETSMRRILSDVQERLIFRAQTYIKDEVGNYRATADDLDFPAKLVRAMKAKADGTEDDENTATNWYPPLERTLTCLTKLYRCVEIRTFAGLAQEAVSLCADNIAGAARTVATKASAVDGHLFLIKHLIILREQIAPFNADFSVAVKDLDFTHMRGHMRRMLGGEMSFFSLTPDNALYQLASDGRPRVVESTIDSKKELEKQLKAACEVYIMSITKEIVDPMLSFITKVTAFRVSSKSQGKSIKDAAFASEDKLTAIAKQVNAALDEILPKAVYTMNLYLNSQSTREALLKPIKSNVAEAHAQIAAILDAEFPPGFSSKIGILDPARLAAAMES